MATPAIIKVPGSNICLYKHYDGNPGATLAWLEDFNKRFTAERGADPEYKMAQLVRDSVINGEKYNLDPSTSTGWGLMTSEEAWGDYEYTLEDDGTITYKG